MMFGAMRYPRIPKAAPAIYMYPIVCSSAKSDKKLELEYIGMAT